MFKAIWHKTIVGLNINLLKANGWTLSSRRFVVNWSRGHFTAAGQWLIGMCILTVLYIICLIDMNVFFFCRAIYRNEENFTVFSLILSLLFMQGGRRWEGEETYKIIHRIPLYHYTVHSVLELFMLDIILRQYWVVQDILECSNY